MADNKPKQNLLVAKWTDRDGKEHCIYAPYPADERWQGVLIDSDSFKGLPHTERLYRLSQAYLGAAICQCEQAGEAGKNLDWPQASVCYYLLHLATELFLKACVLRLKKEHTSMNHDIPGLYRQYQELLSSPDFEWDTHWKLSAQDINGALKFDVICGIDGLPDQLFRYGADKSGATAAGTHFFAPSTQMGYMTYLRKRWAEVWVGIEMKAGVQQTAPIDAATKQSRH